MTTYTALSEQLQRLQLAIYNHEFDGWLTMSAADDRNYREALTDCKRALLIEIEAALEWDEAHRAEAIETRFDVDSVVEL